MILFPGCACCGGGGCAQCAQSCCLTIQGRDTCNGGTELVSSTPFVFDEWSTSDGSPAQPPPIAPVANLYESQWQRLSDDGDYLVVVRTAGCVNGQIALDVEVTKSGPSSPATEYTYKRYANAVATLDENGCPTGVALGDVTDQDTGPDGPGGAADLELDLGWLCE